MNTKEILARLEPAKAKAIELLKRDPKKSAIVLGSSIAAIAVLNAGQDGAGLGLGFGGGGSETHELLDQNGPGGRMVAATIETPAGWKVSGGVNWNNSRNAVSPYKVSFVATGEGGRRVEMLPSVDWTTSTEGRPATAESVVRDMFLPKLRPGARVVGVEKDAKSVAVMTEQIRVQIGGGMPGASNSADAVVAQIEYEEGGQRIREQVLSMLMTTEMRGTQADHMMASQVGMRYSTARFQYSQIMTLRAPAAEMEAEREGLQKIVDSYRSTERWNGVVANFKRQKNEENIRNNRTRMADSQRAHEARMAGLNANFQAGQAAHRARTEAADIRTQTYWNNDAARTAANRTWLNGHLGQSDFHNPHTGMVETHSDTGGRMWQDGSGNTFETNTWADDPRMNPNNWNRGIEEMRRMGR